MGAIKCRHCHHYLGFSLRWVWEEAIRLLGLVAMVAAAVVASKSLELSLVAQRERQEALAQAQISRQERDALKEDLSLIGQGPAVLQRLVAAAPDKRLQKAAAQSKDPRVRAVLMQALALKHAATPYAPGGKGPDEGFDSSGFVAYLLAQAGALDPAYQGTFSAARLERSLVSIEPEAAKVGDLVFIGQGFVAVYLGEGMAVGIASAMGIQVFSIPANAACSYRRWAYEQAVRQLR
jgi:cell wall-associated NlpC family hydrolase